MAYQTRLLNWYKENQRKLPWRETCDPYKIWVSEIMLQQTQVATVIDYYNRFIEAFPSVIDLAKANEDLVLKIWEGLGYYSRARKMIHCAKDIVEKYNGKFPKEYAKIIALPGIGPYTAGAVLSIAYNMPYPAVDGNVMRVISRQFNIAEDISQGRSRKVFEEKVESLLPEDRRHFNQSLMELGAVICTPQNPKCNICPVNTFCEANKLQIQNFLPIKTKKIKKKLQYMALAYVKCEGKVLLNKRPSEGLLGGLWGFPIVQVDNPLNGRYSIQKELEENYGLKVKFEKEMSKAKHVFTHLIWDMILYEFCTTKEVSIDYPCIVWISANEVSNYPLPTAFKKLLAQNCK